MSRRASAFLAIAWIVRGAGAQAQHPPPWGATEGPAASSAPVDAPVPAVTVWPAPRPTATRPTEEEPDLATRPLHRGAEDPGMTQHFQMPSAVLLHYGDFAGMYLSHLGWAALRRGFTRYIDAGVGVPFYLLGISLDVRVAFVQREGFAAAWWGYASIPFLAHGDTPSSELGFTWSWAGMGWATGPLVSLWNDRVGVHVGVHLAQRTGLGGVWLLSHVTADVRIVEGIKVLVQGVSFNELSLERSDVSHALAGNGPSRWLPYLLGGIRFYTRRFSADMGVLAPLSRDCPLWSDRLAVIPWVSLMHRF